MINMWDKLLKLFSKKPKEKYWFIQYEDGQVDGGLITFDSAFYVAKERAKSGRKNFELVYREPN